MNQEKKSNGFSILVSDSFDRTDDHNAYEVSFRRWLVSQLEAREMTVSEAIRKFNINPSSGPELIRTWRKRYSDDIISEPIEMTQQERQDLIALQKQIKAMEISTIEFYKFNQMANGDVEIELVLMPRRQYVKFYFKKSGSGTWDLTDIKPWQD